MRNNQNMNQEGIRKGKKRKERGQKRTRTRRGKKKVACLPADTIFSEILPRLPASSLLRLRLVCKAWQSAILDPAFAFTNLKCALDNWPASHQVLINYYRKGELVLLDEELSRPKSILATQSRVSPPCNGLFCIYTWNYYEKYEKRILQLFNPTTRELLPLPRPDNSQFWTFYLVFDPSIYKYKVVCHPSSRLECQVLTVGTDASWRPIESFGPLAATKRRSAVVGGFLYRVVRDGDSLQNVAVLFDVCEEKFRRLSLPGMIEDAFDVDGKPCFVEDYGASVFTRGLHIWMLTDLDREEWDHRCILPAVRRDDILFRGYPDTMVRSRPIFISKEKLILCCCSQLFCIRLRSDDRSLNWEEVIIVGEDQVLYDHAYAYPFAFVGSLISLRSMLTATV